MRSDPVLTGVDVVQLPVRYPRPVGRNARLGDHGSGGTATAVLLDTDSGARGWGLVEGPTAGLDAVVGRPLSELIDPASGLRDHVHLGLDVALHDLLGVVTDQPVHALLGDRGPSSTRVYDASLYFDDLDDPDGVDVVVRHARAAAAAGTNAVKIKIGRGHRWLPRAEGDARDVTVVRAVRDALPTVLIMVDANDGYDLDGIGAFVEATSDAGLHWIEEPFLDDAADLLALRRLLDDLSPTTLVADGECDPDLDLLLPDPGPSPVDVALMDVLSFGITAWRRVAPRLAALGVRGSPHAWGRPLKTLYAAQLAAGLGVVDIVEGVPGRTEGVDTSAYDSSDADRTGMITVPDRPGFGLPLPLC